MKLLLLALSSAVLLLSQVLVQESEFKSSKPADWSAFSAREEIAPRTFTDVRHSRGGPGALAISGNKSPAASGGWKRTVSGVQPAAWYRLTAWYRAEGLTEEENQVRCLLGWEDPAGKTAGTPEFAYDTTVETGWR